MDNPGENMEPVTKRTSIDVHLDHTVPHGRLNLILGGARAAVEDQEAGPASARSPPGCFEFAKGRN